MRYTGGPIGAAVWHVWLMILRHGGQFKRQAFRRLRGSVKHDRERAVLFKLVLCARGTVTF